MHRIFNGKSNLQCCSDGHLTLNGSFERRIRTSLGEFKMDFWRVRCSKHGKTFAPLAKFIGLERYFKDGSILICDGELGLAEAFADYATEQQRCHGHIKRDLYHMMYQDGGRYRDSKPIQDALAGVLAIELPQDDFQKVSEQEKSDIEDRMGKAELAIDKLIGYFDSCGYGTAATYIRRAKCGMFGYIRRWLKWGLISPRASSMVERVMRELGRRLKKTAYKWSDKGATD